jgi:hypothetical protein
MKIKMVWQKLLVDGKRIVTRDELVPICETIGKDYDTVVHYLQVHRFLIRIFKGIFYVRDPEEIQRGTTKLTIYELVAKGLEIKKVKSWYFGLETALKFNNMTHEYFKVNYVITDTCRTTKAIRIFDTEIWFLKWRPTLFEFGIQTINGIKCSDREKTVLDLVYKRYMNKRLKKKDVVGRVKDLLTQFCSQLDIKKFRSYISLYPMRMGNILWQALEESSLKD